MEIVKATTANGINTVTDGVTTITSATELTFVGATVTNLGGGNAEITVTGGGSGTVTSVATNATLTGGPITTTGTLGLNLANANTWSGAQIFNVLTTTLGVGTILASDSSHGVNIAYYNSNNYAIWPGGVTPSSTNYGILFNNNGTSTQYNSTNNLEFNISDSTKMIVDVNGNISVNNLKSGSTAPVTSGTTKTVIADSNGLLSFVPTTTGTITSIVAGTGLTGGTITTTGTIALDLTSANTWTGKLTVSTVPFAISGNQTLAAWGLVGPELSIAAATLTDSSTAAGVTVTNAVANSIGIPTITAANATSGSKVTYTNASTLYIAGIPALGVNTLATNMYALNVASGLVNMGGQLNVSSTINSSSFMTASAGYFINGTNQGVESTNSSTNVSIRSGGVQNRLVIASTGFVGLGSITVPGVFTTSVAATAAAWGLNGINIQTTAQTFTDNSSAVGTVTNNIVNSFGIPTLATTTNAVTYTNAATVYIAGVPVAGSHVTLTNAYAAFITGAVRYDAGSDATGDTYYRAATSGILTRLPIGSTGTILSVSSGLPSWQASSALSVNGVKASADLIAQSAAVASVAAFTTTTTGTYRIGGYLTVTAVVTDVINLQVTWTDQNSTSRTQTFAVMGTTSPSISAVGFYTFPEIEIRALTGTAITVATVLTTGIGSITYDVGATIQQLR